MAHFAQLDENNYVIQVIVVNNDDCLVDGVESESKGIEFCENLLGGRWIQTSYNGNIRKRYGCVGYFYNEAVDEFIAPQPFPSWSLDSNNDWQAPTPRPEGPNYWNEEALAWVEIPSEGA
jgi:hypothetical protein